jgi:hypothetical protein
MSVRSTRAFFLLAGACWLAGCSFLPLTVQSRNVAAQLGLPKEEIATVVRQASAAHRLEAHWVRKVADDSIEIGLGGNATTVSFVYRFADGRWNEVPGSRRTWPSSSDLPTPPAAAQY